MCVWGGRARGKIGRGKGEGRKMKRGADRGSVGILGWGVPGWCGRAAQMYSDINTSVGCGAPKPPALYHRALYSSMSPALHNNTWHRIHSHEVAKAGLCATCTLEGASQTEEHNLNP